MKTLLTQLHSALIAVPAVHNAGVVAVHYIVNVVLLCGKYGASEKLVINADPGKKHKVIAHQV